MQKSSITISLFSDKSQTVSQSGRGRQSPRKSPHRQLPLFDSTQPKQDYPLRIEALPDIFQWWSARRYLLIHKESGLRVPGSFILTEAQRIQKATQCWDWTVNTHDRKVACALNLLALAEIICTQSSRKALIEDSQDNGGEA